MRSYTNRPADRRFWEKVEKGDGCWIWTATTNRKGYGVINLKCGNPPQWVAKLAHRVSWEMHFGAVPDGMHVCHRCDNPRCVNPEHLFVGTNSDNRQDSVLKNRQARGDRSGARKHPERVAKGEKAGQSKLTKQQVLDIRRMASEGAEPKTIAQQFSISARNVRNIISRDSWKHI